MSNRAHSARIGTVLSSALPVGRAGAGGPIGGIKIGAARSNLSDNKVRVFHLDTADRDGSGIVGHPVIGADFKTAALYGPAGPLDSGARPGV